MMMNFLKFSGVILLGIAFQYCSSYSQNANNQKTDTMDSIKKTNNPVYSHTDTTNVNLSDDEWKKLLPKDVYNIARQKGTERPGTSEFEHSKEIGTYYCAVCGNALFKSDTKFESGCGWQVFMSRSAKQVLFMKTIIHTV